MCAWAHVYELIYYYRYHYHYRYCFGLLNGTPNNRPPRHNNDVHTSAYLEVLDRILLLLSVRNSHNIFNSQRGSGRRKGIFFLFGAQVKQKEIVPSRRRPVTYNIPSSAR